MEIKELLTKVNRTIANGRNIKYIVMHYVGGVSTAYNNARYFENVDRQASAHYFVDENEIYRVVAEKNTAWHCGTTGTYYHAECRNSNSIGIEMCCYMNNGVLDISENIVNRTIELTKELMAKYNISADRVIRHYDVTHKICPAPMVNNASRWNALKSKLTAQAPSQPTPVPAPISGYLVKVTTDALNIRPEPNTGKTPVGCIRDRGVYTIIETQGSWGKLKSGAGWICLDYTQRLENTVATPAQPNNEINVGNKVKVKQGAKDYNGQGLASFVYSTTYDVIQVNGDRIVIGLKKAVTCAIHKNNLIKV